MIHNMIPYTMFLGHLQDLCFSFRELLEMAEHMGKGIVGRSDKRGIFESGQTYAGRLIGFCS